MEACSFLLRPWDRTVGKVFLDKRFPLGALFIAAIQPEVHGKTHRTTDIMTRDGIMRERIGVVAMVRMAVHIVEQTPHMLAQGVIEYQHRVGLGTADCLCLLEQIRESPVVDALLEPGCLGEEAGQVGFVSTLQHTAGDVGQTFVVQDDQTCQVVLEMVKLAPILKEITKDLGVGRHDGSGTDDGKLHEVLTLSPRGWDRAEEYHTDVRNGKIQQPSTRYRGESYRSSVHPWRRQYNRPLVYLA